MVTNTTYIERRVASLRALDMEISKLTDYADGATGAVAVTYYGAIHALQETRDKAAASLRELNRVSHITWLREAATADVDDAWKEVRSAVHVAITTTYCEVIRRPSGQHATDGSLPINRVRRIAPRGACY